MDNETTMPGLLTLPGDLAGHQSQSEHARPLYTLIFVMAALVLGITLYLL